MADVFTYACLVPMFLAAVVLLVICLRETVSGRSDRGRAQYIIHDYAHVRELMRIVEKLKEQSAEGKEC